MNRPYTLIQESGDISLDDPASDQFIEFDPVRYTTTSTTLSPDQLFNTRLTAEIKLAKLPSGDSLTGEIYCIKPFGQYPKPELEKIPQSEADLTQWAERINLIKKSDKYYEKFRFNYASFCALFDPLSDLLSGKVMGLSRLNGFYFGLDDVMDNTKDHNICETEEIRNDIVKGINIFIDILKNKYKDLSSIPDLKMPLFMPLCRSLLGFHQTSIDYIPNYLERNYYFVKYMTEYLQSVLWVYKEQSYDPPSEASYIYRRSLTIAVYPTIEYMALMHDITLTKEIRQNIYFKRFQEAGCHAVFLTNDTLSLPKELKLGEQENLIILKTLHKPALSISEAFKLVNDILNDEISDIMKLSYQLQMSYPEDKELNRYINLMEIAVDGHLFWYGNCKRYGEVKLIYKKMSPIHNSSY